MIDGSYTNEQVNNGLSYAELEAYIQGRSRLDALGVNVPPKMRVLEVLPNWSSLVLKAIADRIEVEGFLLPGDSDAEQWIRECWQVNEMSVKSYQNHLETLGHGQAFAVVGDIDPKTGLPTITFHTSQEIVADIDPATGLVRQAWQYYQEGDTKLRNFYSPEFYYTEQYTSATGQWEQVGGELVNRLGYVPVFVFNTNLAMGSTHGRSEILDVITYADAMARTLTGMQISQELLALPFRAIIGENVDAFTNGGKSALDAYVGRLQVFENPETKVLQLSGADLRNFVETGTFYAKLVAAQYGLPMHYMGIGGDNPPSAEGLYASLERLIKTAETKMNEFGAVYERVMRCCMDTAGVESTVSAYSLSTVWRDPSTPTLASKSAAVVQLVQTGIIPPAVARRMIDLPDELLVMAEESDHGSPVEDILPYDE